MSSESSYGAREGALVVLAGGLVGLVISIYLYMTPLTGVTGSLGALIVMAASGAIAFDGLILLGAMTPGHRALWLTLGFLGALGTLAAAYLLHAYGLMAVMVVVLLGLFLVLARPPYRT
ncbi:hypothetical protein U0C82_07285 [Fulvimarina sp. 2208YS6-2-32]|uniref:Major facilitator superfamily (MFS) profile domain-containing protein n=1 Tax=Fulvimarina uroteuthidis TaxID=3098149 RepID=A0ABU5I0N9_9HYPH|nr:hypothetical protein [Fulvimarina sp. 2208YS6-2-32]MDY8108947.1 hypothetical protein [Fulvimarina sp. 2208YS6-2-32]